MSDVKYSLNGKYFKYFGVHVEFSKGLLDKLKPRERQNYVWAEYHGKQIDLSPAKYEARDIVLSCWVKGDNIQKLTEQYISFLSEFDKSGTLRLLVEPFGYKPFVFDVILMDKSEMDKEFRDGEMFGKFTISIQEPNPIKRILYTSNSQLTIAYKSPTETDIIIDGTRYQGKDVVNFTKNLTNRVIVSSNQYGRNLFLGKLFLDASDWPSASVREPGKIKLLTSSSFNAWVFIARTTNAKFGEKYTSSIDVKFSQPLSQLKFSVLNEFPGNTATVDLSGKQPNIWHRVSVTSVSIVDPNKDMLVAMDGVGPSGTIIEYKNFKLEIGDRSTGYSPAPEEQHFISIAGNIEDITNFTTNAEVLWDRI